MTKAERSKSKRTATERTKLAIAPNPNRCFVLFSSTYLTAGSAIVSLNSLVRQLEKHPADRPIEDIRLDREALLMEILFVPEGGDPHAKHRSGPDQGI